MEKESPTLKAVEILYEKSMIWCTEIENSQMKQREKKLQSTALM